jgi:hypothetical protein
VGLIEVQFSPDQWIRLTVFLIRSEPNGIGADSFSIFSAEKSCNETDCSDPDLSLVRGQYTYPSLCFVTSQLRRKLEEEIIR